MGKHGRVELLVDELNAPEVYRRIHARNELTEMGTSATPMLVRALREGSDRHRWEACKTLVTIKDPRAAPVLVESLRDEVMAVRWVAAEALIALGDAAVNPLLHALEEHFESVFLRESAHHVLWGLDHLGVLGPKGKELMVVLANSGPSIRVGVAAHEALVAQAH
jgi:HEAT repeat protein